MALLMVCTGCEYTLNTGPCHRITHLGQACEEARLLILVDPFQILQELYRTAQGIKQVDDRRAVALGAFRFELESAISYRLVAETHSNKPCLLQ